MVLSPALHGVLLDVAPMKLEHGTESGDMGARCVSRAVCGAGLPLYTHASALSKVSDRYALEHSLYVSLYLDIANVRYGEYSMAATARRPRTPTLISSPASSYLIT